MPSSNEGVKIIGANDEKVSVTTRGSKDALAVEILDASGNQIASFGTSSSSSVGDGTRTITTAGVPVQLSTTSVSCKRVFIQSREDNSGTVVIGGSNVKAVTAQRRGFALFATQGEWFYVDNLNLLYLDSTANNDVVHFFYEI